MQSSIRPPEKPSARENVCWQVGGQLESCYSEAMRVSDYIREPMSFLHNIGSHLSKLLTFQMAAKTHLS